MIESLLTNVTVIIVITVGPNSLTLALAVMAKCLISISNEGR